MIRRFSILVLVVATSITVRAQVQAPPAKSSEETGTISGQVVSDNGQPVAGASLFIRAANSFNAPRNTSTDADGNFRFNNLEPGLYSIAASAPAFASDSLPTPTYYRLGDSVRLEMVRGGVITGTVTNSSGDPVIGVRVRAVKVRDAKGQISKLPPFSAQERTTDDRGVYRIYGLLPGTYVISAGGSSGAITSTFNPYENDVPTYSPSATRDNAAEISVRSGEETTADIRYRGEPGYTISGTIKLTTTGGASVILRAVGNSVPLGGAFQMPGARGFAFHGLPDGEYTLRAQEVMSPEATVPQLATSARKRITIKGASVTGIELVTTPMSSISGRIVLEPSKIPECQGKRAPLFAETLVQLQRAEQDAEDEDGIFVALIVGSASTDANGALSWRNVMPGRYRFEPRFYARYWYLKSITTKTPGPKPQTIDAAANWTITKSGDQLTGVTITLAEGAASIRGRLALAEGTVVQPGTILYLVPAEPDKATDVLRFFAADVASDGTFTLSNLPPGKYLALTQTNVDAQISIQAKLREPETEAAAARAKLHRAAEAKKTEIELKPCQNLADYQLKQ
jgi:protocatechuate 3,4-dioxygenase beta subunit